MRRVTKHKRNFAFGLIACLFLFQSLACEPLPNGDLPVVTSRPQEPEAPTELSPAPTKDTQGQSLPNQVKEAPVQIIPLDGPAALAQAEYSGMAWYQDQLVLLPQYPQRMSDHADGLLYAITRQEILDFIQGVNSQPIRPREVILKSQGVEKAISQFEGFEAIAFDGQQVYLTIEAREGLKMIGYLVKGEVQGNLNEIHLELDSLTKNPPQQEQSNRTDEAILIAEDQLLTFFESNGAQANPDSHASLFDLSLTPSGILEFPAIEYRLTDATEMDASGRFWMMNYFFPGDTDLLPLSDPIRETYGAGITHTQSETVERLLEFQYSPQGIKLSGTPPIQFQLASPEESRNWEGLVRLDDLGFLIVTDKFPVTILGFIAYP